MPILSNPRHERFAQELAKGSTAENAYIEAGFKPSRPHASRLATNGNISTRVAEIQSRAASAVGISKEWVIEQLVEHAKLAREAGDFAPANKAVELLGKELGMFIDRKEVGKPGEFDELTLEQKQERAIALTKQFGLNRTSPTSGSA